MRPFDKKQETMIWEILDLLDGLTDKDHTNIICATITTVYGTLKDLGQQEDAEYYFELIVKKINHLYETRDRLEKFEEREDNDGK